jgi:hypothetical protein
MKTILSLISLGFGFSLNAQNTQVIINKIIKEYPGSPKMFEAEVKVLNGTLKADGFLDLTLPNGDKGYAQFEFAEKDEAPAGTTAKFYVKAIQTDVRVGQKWVSRELSKPILTISQKFEIESPTFFIMQKDEYMLPVQSLKGKLSVGDALEAITPKGQKCAAKVTEIKAADKYIIDLLTPSTEQAYVMIKTNGCEIPSQSRFTSVGLVGNTSSPVAQAPTFKGERNIMPINAVLENEEVRITVHNIIKYKPKPNAVTDAIMKVDYTLDYYILDATLENKTNKTIEGGDYMLRLNFFTAEGESADEFGRIFKNKDDKKDEIKNQADAIDKAVFGGTSALRFAPVMVKYQEDLPNYDKTKDDAIWGKLEAKQKVHCETIKAIGVPKSYLPTHVGAWKDSRKKWFLVAINR